MSTNRIAQYHLYTYDALDRLVGISSKGLTNTELFYLKDRLVTEIQGALQYSIVQYEDKLLAKLERQHGELKSTFLITDQQRSVLATLNLNSTHSLTYTPYGYHLAGNSSRSMIGFNGERLDPVSDLYSLGNGYRSYNPVLMRFNSPDSWSPFKEGGINAYAAFKGNPLYFHDPTGHAPTPITLTLLKAVSRFKRGLTSIKKAAAESLSDNGVLRAKILKTHSPDDLVYEIASRKIAGGANDLNIRIISKAEDLSFLDKEGWYKYIYTNRKELILGRIGRNNEGHFSHPFLTQFAQGKNVIGAGHIARVDGRVIVSNQSGHYYVEGLDTTTPVISHLRGLGVQAQKLRNERSYKKIPQKIRGQQ